MTARDVLQRKVAAIVHGRRYKRSPSAGPSPVVHPDGDDTPTTVPEIVAPDDAAGAAAGIVDEGAPATRTGGLLTLFGKPSYL
jgi:hypothetical protein